MTADPAAWGVSVVIPVRDGARFLAEAVGSAVAQTYRPIEVVVVDDGSTDATPVVAAELGGDIRYLRQAHQGISAARNRGVASSTMPLIAFLDADDLWQPDKLRIQVAEVRHDPEVDLVFTHVDEFLDGDVALRGGSGVRVPMQGVPGIIPSSMLVRRSAFDRVGPFAVEVRLAEFADWYARAQEAGLRMLTVPDSLVRRRIHGANHGLLEPDQHMRYARVLKAALDRRRRLGGTGGG